MTNIDPLDTAVTSELSCDNGITAHFVVFGRVLQRPDCQIALDDGCGLRPAARSRE